MKTKLVTKTLKAKCIEVSMSATKTDMNATISAQGLYPFSAKVCVTITGDGTVIVHGATSIFYDNSKVGEITNYTEEDRTYTRVTFTEQ